MHKSYMILITVLSTICLSGCWDRAELQDLSIVSGIGIDKGGNDIANRYRTTVQIINPSQVAGGQQGGKVQSAPVVTFSATGSTLKEAFRKISLKAPSQLFFPHAQVMLIGEEIANEGILELFDVIERDPNFRLLFPVLIVKGHSAEEALKITSALIPISSLSIKESLESSAEIWGEYPKSRADQVIANVKEGSLGITGIQVKGKIESGNKTSNIQQISQGTSIEITGLALIKNGKIEKWIEENSARGVMWVNNEMKRTVMILDCPKKKDAISVDIHRAKSDIKVNIKNEKPVINLSIITLGTVTETQCIMDFSQNKTILKLEEQLGNEIKNEVIAAIKSAQEEKIDIFRFGEHINIKDPKYWKKVKNKWEEEIFQETEINVNVLTNIRRSEMRMNSYLK